MRRHRVWWIGAWIWMGLGAWAVGAPAGKWQQEIGAFVEADRRQPPAPGAVMFYGSSSFRKWTDVAAAFPRHRVVNRGFGGSQLSDLIEFFDVVVVPHAPRILLVYGGDNDLASGKDPARVEADFRALVGKVRQALPKTRVAFLAIKPSPVRASLLPQVRDANARVRRFARGHARVDYLDTASPVTDSSGQPDPRFFLADRLHLNADGYRAWQAVLGPYLDRRAPLASP